MEDKEVWNDVEVPNVETESKVEYEIETEETMEQAADSAPSQEEGRITYHPQSYFLPEDQHRVGRDPGQSWGPMCPSKYNR